MGNYFQDQVRLSVSKASRIVNMGKKYPHLVEKQLFPSEMKALTHSFEQADIHFYGYSLKNIVMKHNVTGAQILKHCILLTHE